MKTFVPPFLPTRLTDCPWVSEDVLSLDSFVSPSVLDRCMVLSRFSAVMRGGVGVGLNREKNRGRIVLRAVTIIL